MLGNSLPGRPSTALRKPFKFKPPTLRATLPMPLKLPTLRATLSMPLKVAQSTVELKSSVRRTLSCYNIMQVLSFVTWSLLKVNLPV